MFEEREEARKLGVAMIQLVVVVLVGFAVRAIPYSDIKPSGIAILAFLHIASFYFSDAYYQFYRRGYLEGFLQVLKYNLVFVLGIAFLSFMMEENFVISRRGIVYFAILNTLSIYVTNLVIKYFHSRVNRRIKSRRQVVLLTDGIRLDRLWTQLQDLNNANGVISAAAVFDQPQAKIDGVIMLQEEEVIHYVTHSVVDEVLISLPSDIYDIPHWVGQLELMGVDVSVVVNSLDFPTISEKRVHSVAGLGVITFSTRFYRTSHIIAKRVLDICGALVGLFICGLVGLFVAPLIRRDGGPAIFVQKRVGQNGRIFKFYKFRSMYVDAEERKKELLAQNTMHGGMFKMDNDPRITPIGKFLRKTSLDELPQFWNVLRGDMSLVGTRPPTVDEYETYTPAQKRRLSFKPGITGLWQVSGRSEITDFDQVVALDVAYIDGWTIWSDIKILLKTLKVVFLGRGAK